jgi:hypothetical protein
MWHEDTPVSDAMVVLVPVAEAPGVVFPEHEARARAAAAANAMCIGARALLAAE